MTKSETSSPQLFPSMLRSLNMIYKVSLQSDSLSSWRIRCFSTLDGLLSTHMFEYSSYLFFSRLFKLLLGQTEKICEVSRIMLLDFRRLMTPVIDVYHSLWQGKGRQPTPRFFSHNLWRCWYHELSRKRLLNPPFFLQSFSIPSP